MNKIYNNQQKNQANLQQKQSHKLDAIKSLKPNRILTVINMVVNQCLYYNNNYYESEATMAKKLSISPRTVCRALKKARELGIIKRKRRINNSNVYFLNQGLRNPTIIDELASVLPALRGLLCLSFLIPLTILCQPAPKKPFQENGEQYKDKVYLTSSLSLSLETSTKEWRWSGPGAAAVFANRGEEDPEKSLQGELHSENTGQGLVKFAEQLVQHIRTGYACEETALEFKEFVDERLPRLAEMLEKTPYDMAHRQEIIERQLQSYRDRLHFKDKAKLRSEGYPA
jgi:DNA-binding Lrp family transcriptional regulator